MWLPTTIRLHNMLSCTLFGCLLFILEAIEPTISDSGIANTSPESLQHDQQLPFKLCKNLKMGQYYCADPQIDNDTQQPVGCSKELQKVKVDCYPAPGINCTGEKVDREGKTVFHKEVPCKYTNGKHFSVALLLSVFLGMFGIDRFYLGYPAIGLLKLCTFGFMLLGQLIDVILIALQVVGPADGSHYVIDYYGPGLININSNNETYIKPQYDYEDGYNVEL